MGERMVEMICAVQPVGPYRLAGWGFGGTLAYEIATQLIGADHQVEFLGLLDTDYIPGLSSFPDRFLAHFDTKDEPTARESLEGASIKTPLNASSISFALVDKCPQMALCPDRLNDPSAKNIRDILDCENNYQAASVRYSAQELPIHVHLFVAQDNDAADPLLGWTDFISRSRLRLIPITGTHQSMLSSPNVETLGSILSHSILQSAGSSGKSPDKLYSPLVTLQAGQDNVEPLFCIPGAGANVVGFIDLIAHLDQARPVYGFQPRGLDGTVIPYSKVSTAAHAYIQAISNIQPRKPIHLLGHSFGGWIAFEMAQLLVHTERPIASLTIIDSEAPGVASEYNSTEILLNWVNLLEQLLERPLPVELRDLDLRTDRFRRRFLHNLLVEERFMPWQSDPDLLLGPLNTFAMSLRTSYKPSMCYLGQVRLVLVGEPHLSVETNDRNQENLVGRWRQWAPKLIYTHAPGNHMTVLKPPYVRHLARLIK